MKRLLGAFNEKEIVKFINEKKAENKVFCQEICSIINVISILKRLEDYGAERMKEAFKNPEQINMEENRKAIKAQRFRLDMYAEAMTEEEPNKKDQEDRFPYPYIKEFIDLVEVLVLSIEISSDDGNGKLKNQNLYFPNHPVFSYLAPDTKDDIMFRVGRENRRDKLTTLFGYYDELKREIDFNYDLKYYSLNLLGFRIPVSITSSIIGNLRKFARWTSYIICLLMLMFIVVDHDTKSQESYFNFFYYYEKVGMRVLTIIQLFLTLLFFVLWIKMRWSLCLQKLEEAEGAEEGGGGGDDEAGEEEEDGDIALPAPERTIDKVTFYTVHYAIKISKLFFKTMRRMREYVGVIKYYSFDKLKTLWGVRHVAALLYYLLHPVYAFFRGILRGLYALVSYQGDFLAIVIFVLTALLGNFYGIEWYVLHLFDFFVGISQLTNIFKAVIDNISELLLLSAFAGCFIMVFNVVSLNIYTPVIYEDDIPS